MFGPGRAANLARIAYLMLRKQGEIVTMTIKGDSMNPTIRPGDQIHVRMGSAAPKIGDVILFQFSDELHVHRIIRCHGKNERNYTTKGDANAFADRHVVPSLEIIGQVIACERPESAAKSADLLTDAPAVIMALLSNVEDKLASRGRTVLRHIAFADRIATPLVRACHRGVKSCLLTFVTLLAPGRGGFPLRRLQDAWKRKYNDVGY